VDLACQAGHGYRLSSAKWQMSEQRGKGTVAVKYRDPENPQNTWTGRGRMPRWMVAAIKGNKTKKEDFFIS
jgi:DNA-binding protein H-NS